MERMIAEGWDKVVGIHVVCGDGEASFVGHGCFTSSATVRGKVGK